MKTQDEIVQRILERKKEDPFGFEVSIYVDYLDYEYAKQFLKPNATKEQWDEATAMTKSPPEAIKDYMPYAWDKANSCRGISANRSIEHMIAWMWLDGKDWLEYEYNHNYQYYGKPQLIKICEEYDIDWQKLDNGERTNG